MLNIRNKKQGGFTLLELLVVVAIMAAIAAATATILLDDTDRKAAAAAHVTIMDELIKGTATYRVLNQGMFPDNWDSMMSSNDGNLAAANANILPAATPTAFGLDENLSGMVGVVGVTAAIQTALNNVGIVNAQVLHTIAANDPNGAANPGTCENMTTIRTMIADRASDITNSSIFMTFGAARDRGGCGASDAIRRLFKIT